MTEEFLTVSQLNGFIKDVINMGFPRAVWLCGEIQGYNRNRMKNHIFFELIEKDRRSRTVVAKVGLVIFSGRKSYIESVLKRSENAFTLKDDIEVKFSCKVDFYAPHGAVRLIVEDIDPVYTLGKLAQEKQKLIALLKENGVLDKNKALDLPLVPLNVGLITSDDSAAHNDFQSELARSGFGFKIYLRNTLMQGSKTEGDVCQALTELARIKSLDVIIITRGGGSIADLSCFDSQRISEKIAACPRPVLSGIGHEINTSITDLAAHTFAKTPTAIAQFLINKVQEFLDRLSTYKDCIVDGAKIKLEQDRQRLKDGTYGLHHSTIEYLREHNMRLIRVTQVMESRPNGLIRNRKNQRMNIEKVFVKTIERRLENDHKQLESYQKMIDMVHPANTIKRGFTITRTADGKILKSVQDVQIGASITTEFGDGVIESDVKMQKSILT